MVLARLKRDCLRMASRVCPTSLLGKDPSYALSQWQALEVYRNRGDMEIDNNQVYADYLIMPTSWWFPPNFPSNC
ncbi:MAG: transposase [Verrucomicrobiales bacterium]